jgi:hypothetical protein
MMAKWYTELLMMGLQRTDAVYHATCMTNYLLKRIKDDSEEYLTSQNDILFQSFFSTIKDDLLTHKKIFTLTQLLELFFLNFCPLTLILSKRYHISLWRHVLLECAHFALSIDMRFTCMSHRCIKNEKNRVSGTPLLGLTRYRPGLKTIICRTQIKASIKLPTFNI